MSEQRWKVGELAARTGLTVRTLHHYDAVGLLVPSDRTGSAHRLYTAADVARLHQIVCLKQLGFGLEQIRAYLAGADYDPREAVRLHLAEVRERATELAELGARLQSLSEALDAAGEVSADTFLQTIEAIHMVEQYYTPEQLKQLEERRKAVGEEAMNRAPQQWADLQAEVKAEMDAGTDPAAPKVQEMAKRWLALVTAFTGGDPGVFKSLSTMYEKEDSVRGTDVAAMRPMMDYVGKAMAAAGIGHEQHV